MKSRKQRRLEARLNGVKFEPQYNGNSPTSYNEHYEVGNERFNNKFVDFTVKSEVVAESTMESDVVDIDTPKETGLLAKAKRLFKKGRR